MSASSSFTTTASIHLGLTTSSIKKPYLKSPIFFLLPRFHQLCSRIVALNHHHHPCPSRCHVSSFSTAADIEGEEEEEVPVPATSVVPEGSRLYVGNLPYTVNSSELAEIFREAGTVESVEVVYDRVTDRSRGFGFVTMGGVAEAKTAIKMFNGSQVGGRSVKVNFPEVPRGGEKEVMGPKIRRSYQAFVESPFKVYAGNLGWRVTSDQLKQAFQPQVGLLGAKVIYERESGKSRGYGFVSFASQEEAESAIAAMNGILVEGRPLRLKLAVERVRVSSSPPTSEETDP